MHMHDTVYESCVMHMYMCIQTFQKKNNIAQYMLRYVYA